MSSLKQNCLQNERKQKRAKVELLAPAGSLEALKAAVNAGADAVYIGGTKFGARAYADNLSCEELLEAMDYCHLRGRKMYLTVNTLLKEKELEDELIPYLKPLYLHGLDAVILQDRGAIDLIGQCFPGLDIHLSTQTAVMTAEGAKELQKISPSVTRVVPARELSLDELKTFREASNLEMEVFIHGALCYSYSGQCLMSSLIGARSGNRGRCAQPCRKLYTDDCDNTAYLMSLKDICTVRFVEDMINAGIDSFKIEGRMKSAEYTAGVVSIYRKLIDDCCNGSSARTAEADIAVLKDIYNRGGFNEGYLKAHNGPDMMSFKVAGHSGIQVGRVIRTNGREAVIRFDENVNKGDVLEIRKDEAGTERIYEFTMGEEYGKGSIYSVLTMKGRTASKNDSIYRTRNNRLLETLKAEYIEKEAKESIEAHIYARVNEPLRLTFFCYGKSFTVIGPAVEEASNKPVDFKSIEKSLTKLGETCFSLNTCDIKYEVSENAFIPASVLNNLRREAADGLKDAILEAFRRSEDILSLKRELETDCAATMNKRRNPDTPVLSVLAWTKEQAEAAISSGYVSELCFNISSFDNEAVESLAQSCEKRNIDFTIGLPYILRYSHYQECLEFVSRYSRCGFLVRNNEELGIMRKLSIAGYCFDYNYYVFNSRTAGLEDIRYTIPIELNIEELESLPTANADMIIYGYMPAMFSVQCVYKNTVKSCRPANLKSMYEHKDITDEKGYTFRSRQLCGYCMNIIYNSQILNLIEYIPDFKRIGIGRFRIDLTFENYKDSQTVICSFHNALSSANKCRIPEIQGNNYTTGHIRRGVN